MAVSAFILAGEASGDRLAALLMDAGGNIVPDIEWFGVGGPHMHERGLNSLADMDALSIIGIADALRQFSVLSSLADTLINAIMERQPDYVFTVDSKGFSLRFAKRLRRALKGGDYQPKLIHMVAPTVWAWGGWRAQKFSQLFDHILCLFPFEPDYFISGQGRAVFVGHPDADGQCRPVPPSDDGVQILLLPGSRKTEILRHLPVMLEGCDALRLANPSLRFRVPILAHLHPLVSSMLAQSAFKGEIELTDIPVQQAFTDAHFILASSGTVTLEAAIAGVPGLVIYHLSRANRIFARLFFKPNTPVLPDIILDTKIYPFLLPPQLNAAAITQYLQEGLQNLEARNAETALMSDRLKLALSPDGQPFAERLHTALAHILAD